MKEYKYKINGNNYNVSVGDIVDNIAEVMVNGMPYKVELENKQTSVNVVSAPRPSAVPRTPTGEKIVSKPQAAGASKQVTAPLPGTILSISAKAGDIVKAADTVMILEAMKMENSIHAGFDGKIASINVNAGDSVLEGTVLFTIE